MSFATATWHLSDNNPLLRWLTTLVVSLTGCIATCGNSVAAPTTHAIVAEFHSSDKVGILATSLAVLGFG